MKKPTLNKAVRLAALISTLALSEVTLAAPVPLNFSDGGTDASPNNTDVDGYPGAGGSGWVGAWDKPENFNDGGSVGAGIESVSPLNGGGNYLNVDFSAGQTTESGRGGVSRQYDGLELDYTQPHTITFDYRVDSLPTGFDNLHDRIQIVDANLSTAGTGGHNTWGLYVIAQNIWGTAGHVWTTQDGAGFAGSLTDLTPAMTVVEGTTYSFSLDLDPENNLYNVSVTDGTNTATGTDLTFRRQQGDVGGFLGFSLVGSDIGDMGEFSVDSIHISGPIEIPDRTWINPDGGDWEINTNWSGGPAPNANNENAIFGAATTRSRTVFTDANVTVNSITFDNPNSYAIVGAGSVTLEADSGHSGITVDSGSHQFQVVVNLNSDTDLDTAAGTTLTFNNALSLTGNTLTKSGAGELTINNILSTGGGTLNCDEGVCSGSGTVAGNLNNNGGTISPGNSPGILAVSGDYAQSSGGTLEIELGGLLRGGEYDVLEVVGEMTLGGGELSVTLIGDFAPTHGDSFDILDFESLTGNFDDINLPAGFNWNTSQLLSEGILTVAVPEPSAAGLLALGCFASLLLRAGTTSLGFRQLSVSVPLPIHHENSIPEQKQKMKRQTLSKTVGLAALVSTFALCSATVAEPLPLNFSDGGTDAAPNNTDVDGYPGVGGGGWVGAWEKPEDFNDGGSVGAEIVSANPLNGGGNYLNVDFLAGVGDQAGRGGVSRQYDNAERDYTQPHTITFDYRVDTLPPFWGGFTDDRIQIYDSTSSTAITSGDDTWGIFAIGTDWAAVGTAGMVWSALTGGFALTDLTPAMTVVPGTTYSFTIDLDPENNLYNASVTDGTNTATGTDLTFRRQQGTVGGHLGFSMVGSGFADTGQFSVDSIHISGPIEIPDRTWNNPDGGDWETNRDWSDGSAPNANNENAIFGAAIMRSRTVFTDADVTVNSITFDNPNSYVIAGTGSVSLEADSGNSGIMINNGSHQFQVIVNLNSDTDLDTAAGTTLTFNNALSLTGNTLTKSGAGELTINNILSTGGGTLNCDEGVCSGSGTVAGNLNNNGGTISPGNSPGILAVSGDYAQGSDGTLEVELGGLLRGGEYDVLEVVGEMTLGGGELSVTLIGDFAPAPGANFDILDFASLTGNFDDINLPLGFNWNTSQLLSEGILSVAVPEPSAAGLLALGWLASLVLTAGRRCRGGERGETRGEGRPNAGDKIFGVVTPAPTS